MYQRLLPRLHSVGPRGHSIISTLTLVLLAMLTTRDAAAVTIGAGYPQLNGGMTPLWLISEAKIDRQYGLDLKPVYIPGGARLTQTIVSGDVDIAITGGAAVNAMLSGADIIYVGMPVPTYAFSLYARSDIKEVPDLRGKVLGVITKGASSDHASIALLRQYKMSQGKDVKVLYFSRQQDALAALDKGIVSAAIHSAPTTLMARRLGYKELVNIGSLKLPYPFAGIAVRRSLIRQNPDVVKVPYVTEEAIRAALSVTDHPKAATADPRDFFDNRFLKEMESTGFVKELYRLR
ncbi:MAG: ABC transporter substrate-binding protein [Deltaproteobacteria bacterium]|nr:ABC transporter substrate-binding protein [Deltaproteobacteria bacterium]